MKNRNFLSVALLAIIFFFASCAGQKYVIVSPPSGRQVAQTTTSRPVAQYAGRPAVQQRRGVVSQSPVMQQGAVMARPVMIQQRQVMPGYGYNPISAGYYGNSYSYYPSWQQLQIEAAQQRGYGYGYSNYNSYNSYGYGYNPYGYGVQPRVGIGVNGNAISVSYRGRNFGISVSGGWNSNNQQVRYVQPTVQRPIIYPTY